MKILQRGYEDSFIKIASLLGGDDYVQVARALLNNENSTDEEIAAITNMKINVVRKALYDLFGRSLIIGIRVRDIKKGWFVYRWKAQRDQVGGFIHTQKKKSYERLKQRLHAEGLFDVTHKRQLPSWPRAIGVVTSATGAALQDVLTVTKRRCPIIPVILYQTPVQGEGASVNITRAIDTASRRQDCDVLIVGRGGGALEDLWPFNEENVAYSIFSSPVPVVSAIGHETDVTIADLVADYRAPTPSVAAEMAVPDVAEITTTLITNEQSLSASIFNCIVKWEEHIKQLQSIVDRGLPDLDGLKQRIDDRLTLSGTHLIHGLKIKSERFQALSHRLTSLSPDVTLQRGYAIVQNQETGKIVMDSTEVESGDLLDITVSVGSIEAKATLADRTKE